MPAENIRLIRTGRAPRVQTINLKRNTNQVKYQNRQCRKKHPLLQRRAPRSTTMPVFLLPVWRPRSQASANMSNHAGTKEVCTPSAEEGATGQSVPPTVRYVYIHVLQPYAMHTCVPYVHLFVIFGSQRLLAYTTSSRNRGVSISVELHILLVTRVDLDRGQFVRLTC